MKASRVIVLFVASFVVIGGFLPALLPAYSVASGLPPSKLQTVCNVLYFLQNVLPSGTSDAVRIAVGIFNLALWGLAGAMLFLVCRYLVTRRLSTMDS